MLEWFRRRRALPLIPGAIRAHIEFEKRHIVEQERRMVKFMERIKPATDNHRQGEYDFDLRVAAVVVRVEYLLAGRKPPRNLFDLVIASPDWRQ